MHHNKNLKVKAPPKLYQTAIVRIEQEDGTFKDVPMNRATRRKAGIR